MFLKVGCLNCEGGYKFLIAIFLFSQELSKTYITPENIDKAIEEALENKLDFNYALDTRGNKYVGRYVNASGTEDLPETGEVDDEQLPPLFQSSPIVSQSTSGK